MAEIEGGSGKGKKGGGHIRSKKSSTKVDMTPMVDLAFLLITFFMLTTTLNKPQALGVNMPKDDSTETNPLPASKTLTVILGENDQIYYYVDVKAPDVSVTDYSAGGIRHIVSKRLKEVPDLTIVIKPQKKSKYKNVVDILDEMHITKASRYAIVKITPEDDKLVELEKKHLEEEKNS